MKLKDVLLVLGTAAVVSIAGIETIKRLHRDDMPVLPASYAERAPMQAADDITQVSKIPEAPTEQSQLVPTPSVPDKKRRLVAVASNGDGTYRDVYEDEAIQLKREEDTFSYITLQPGQLPGEITKTLKTLQSRIPDAATTLEMNRKFQAGTATASDYLTEEFIRSRISSWPDLRRNLNFSVSCAAKICELQAVRAIPGMPTNDITDALFMIAMSSKELRSSTRTSMQLPVGDAPYWVLYWEARE